MDIQDLVYRLKRYPKITIEFLRLTQSKYINIYQLGRICKLDHSSAKSLMYDLIEDGIVDKYQTTFKLSDDFLKLKGQL